jgi:hypothetical protein
MLAAIAAATGEASGMTAEAAPVAAKAAAVATEAATAAAATVGSEGVGRDSAGADRKRRRQSERLIRSKFSHWIAFLLTAPASIVVRALRRR